MKTQEAINYFGDIRRLAQALDTWPQTINNWKDYPPLARQYHIYVKSNHSLLPEDMVNEDNR